MTGLCPSWVIRVDFGMSAACPVRGVISDMPVAPFCQTTENCPTGKSAKTCPAPLIKIFRLTRRANHLYKFAPSHPTRGGSRVVTNARWDAMDATASGVQWDRRAGLPVSDRPARGRTTLLTAFARTHWAARGPARSLARDGRGRRSRVVLAPRCWRQVLRRCVRPNRVRDVSSIRKATVANKPGHRGEHEVSRNPFAQGKPA